MKIYFSFLTILNEEVLSKEEFINHSSHIFDILMNPIEFRKMQFEKASLECPLKREKILS